MKAAGGRVVAVCVMVNRNPKLVTSDLVGAPLLTLGVLPADAWDEEKCPLCKEGKPINTTVGHGKKYLVAKEKR